MVLKFTSDKFYICSAMVAVYSGEGSRYGLIQRGIEEQAYSA